MRSGGIGVQIPLPYRRAWFRIGPQGYKFLADIWGEQPPTRGNRALVRLAEGKRQ
jgi:hypothetical protein